MNMSREKFHEWVKKWDIGPGMNDRWHGRGDPPLGYEPPKNYTGFDGTVGDGWVPVLDRLASDLIKMGWDRNLYQVKEKFGGLRFYIGNGSDEISARIRQAEEECDNICEDCGAPGEIREGGWLRTLCDSCHGRKR